MKLWGGRFTKSASKLMDDFHSSISFDFRLYKQDIEGSIAHATMLGEQGIIPLADAKLIVSELKQILFEIENGSVEFSAEAEDIHMNIETLLISRIGDAGKRLHTGRSRNDQVALDIKMYLREECTALSQNLKALCATLIEIATKNTDTIMPGYTHLQKAQPITLAHHTLAYFQMFARDIDRLSDCKKRLNVSPLGSGALAGTTYPLNRERTAELLGFDGVTQNSIDGVSDRDYCIELASCCSIIMMHLSRYCEELILWSSNEFGFVEIDDAFATGSSIMPQKKNPDVAELIRGKTGRVYGDLTALLTIMKALPLAYNKDMQEDKEAIFDAVDTVKSCLEIFNEMLVTAAFNKSNMRKGAEGGFTNATDAADYLVKKGLPFRDAHEVLGKLVLYCLQNKKTLDGLSIEEYKSINPIFEKDIYEAIALETCIEARCITGSPASIETKKAIAQAKAFLEKI